MLLSYMMIWRLVIPLSNASRTCVNPRLFIRRGMKVVSCAGRLVLVDGSLWKERSGGVGKYVGRIQISIGQGPRGSTERERRQKSRKGFSERVSKRHQRREAAPFPPVEYKSNTCECIVRSCFVLREDQCEGRNFVSTKRSLFITSTSRANN